ncbi:hypothetical protein DYB26_012993, partial [Aphanomyces astaci]
VADVPVTTAAKVLVIGTKETNGLTLAQSILTHLNHGTTPPSSTISLLTHAIASLIAGTDNAASTHVYLPLSHSVLVSVVVAQLPTAVLVTTCLRPHAISSLVRSHANDSSTSFVVEAKAVAACVHAEITVIQGEDLNTQRFGGIYGVGKAAANPPALVVLSHYPSSSSKSDKSFALVGKGIVYDTEGLTAVLAGTSSRPLHVVLCLAKNAVGPLATHPDDIHTLYSGKTVEINNTDAEGRLVLGDGVAYAAKHLNPHAILDMATLTGAQGIATGAKHAAVVSNSAKLEAWVVSSGRASGDFVHAMPYVPEFFRQEFKSKIADMKNIPATRMNAQVSCAGQFISNHLGLEFEQTGLWGHVDMAFPVVDQERGTGFGVALVQSLLQLIE